MSRRSTTPAHVLDLRAGLQARRAEIEEAVLVRVSTVAGPFEDLGSEYGKGFRQAVSAAVDYGLGVATPSWAPSEPVPLILIAQARLAARNGVSLDTVLRRYVAGYALLNDFLTSVALEAEMPRATLRGLLRRQATVLDRVLAAVAGEHDRESEDRLSGIERRARERIEDLLAGDTDDTADFAYDFESHHLGVVARGDGAAEAVHALARPLDCRLLMVHRNDGSVWAWLGSRQPDTFAQMGWSIVGEVCPVVALGEPGRGLAGWRHSHRQAMAALPVALRRGDSLLRFGDVALLSSVFRDDLLSSSLRGLYLEPLERSRDGGETARKTLRAFFAAENNLSSAAASLGVTRRTVANRLRAIEGLLGRHLKDCVADLQTALALHDLDHGSDPVNKR